MAKLTKHGKRRVSERIGATSKAAEQNVKRAFRRGITHSETYDELHSWMSGKFLSYKSASNMRIYRGYLYIFNKDVLITVYPLPEQFANIEEFVDADAYDRYISCFKDSSQKKEDEKNKKYKELRAQFDRKVMLNDIREYAKTRYSVEISGVGIEEKAIRIFYIPTDYEIPDLSGITEYIKDCTIFRSVRFIHATDDNGKRIYRKKYDIEESELVYSI